MAKSNPKTDFSIESTMIWAGWCPIHNGSPPPYDQKGYKCGKCGKLVCSQCLYISSKGSRCRNCLADLSDEEKKKLKPFYEPDSFSQTRKNYLYFIFVIFIISYLLLVFSVLYSFFTGKTVENQSILLSFLTILLFLAISIYYYSKFKRESKK